MSEVPFHQDSQVVRGFIRFSRTIAVLMIAVASIVLLAWWWDARLPTAVAPGQRRTGEVAARILDAFRGFAWPQRAVTISIGVAQSAPSDGITDLILRADAALYDAKHAGRNRAVATAAAQTTTG